MPKTFLINPEVLVNNKQKIRDKDQFLSKALSGLVIQAEQAMGNGPYSVTLKSKVPPSGDKHDYMSVGPYWWPDPKKQDGLPYIRKDGEVNPERFDIPDADFFKELCRDVHLLAIAGFYTDNSKYSQKAIELLRIWFIDESTKMNPNLNYGQAIPGIVEGRGIGLIDTRTLVNLIDGIQILHSSGDMTVSDYNDLKNWFALFYDWMTKSPIGLDEDRQHNNHGTYYDVQVVSIALFLDKTDIASEILLRKTKQRIINQIEANGSQPHELNRTLSWGYSVMNLLGFFELASLAERVNIDLWNYVSSDGKSIQKAFFWLLPYATNEKIWAYQQIKPINKSSFIKLAEIACTKYTDERISAFLNENEDRQFDYIFVLTH